MSGLKYGEEREQFYSLTSLMFMAEPSDSTSNTLFNILKNEYFPLAKECRELATLHDSLMQKLEGIDENVFSEKLKQEYYDLFFDPHLIKASPWQSSYTNSEGLLFQEPDYEARKLYTKWGFKVVHDNYPRDHIAIELDFMRLLSQKLNQGDNSSVDDMKFFLENHLLSWIDDFVSALLKGKSEFYLNFARLVKAGCSFDKELLAEL